MNQQNFKIRDNSGDKKYFALVPYYIINHSTAYEQSLYLVMKRIASENGTCWASAETIGKTMGVSDKTVKKYRKKLLQRGWIKYVGKRRSGRTMQSVDEYEIVDLWKLNIEYYSKAKVENNSTFENKSEVGSIKVENGSQKVEPVSPEEERRRKKDKEDTSFKNLNIHKNGNRGYRPFYKGEEMRMKDDKWWVIPKEGGSWCEYNDKAEKIEWIKVDKYK